MSREIVIVGAGVSGLVAALELQRRGFKVTVLEARDRPGGRILGVRPPDASHAFDLGAEFIHGGSDAFWSFLKRKKLSVNPVPEVQWLHADGKIVPADDLWDRIENVLRGIDPFARQRGESFGTYLKEAGESIAEEDRFLAKNFVEGFEAAPTAEMSAAALRESAGASSEQYRLAEGYTRLVSELLRQLNPRDALRLNTVVTNVSWQRGQVEVETKSRRDGETATVRAQALLLTVPLGVLKASPPAEGAIRFSPELKAKADFIDRLEMGVVSRLLLRFQKSFWTDSVVPFQLRENNGARFGFVHSRNSVIPVWWSLAPDPVVVGWIGGPAAKDFLALPREQQLEQALAALASLFGTEVSEVKRLLVDAYAHNWADDPFSRGAYTFAKAGAENLPSHLGEPLESTLFFAGEATAETEDLGTVHGAWESGLRAVREILSLVK